MILSFCIFVAMSNDAQSGNLFDYRILKRIFRFVAPYRYVFLLIIFLTIVLGFIAPIMPLLVNLTIDNYIKEGNMAELDTMLIIMTTFLAVRGMIQYFHTYLSGWLGQTVIRDIRTKLYRHITRLKLSFFDTTPIGRLVTRNISDIETLSDVFTEGLAAIIGDLLQVIAIFFVMLLIDWRLALLSLCTLPFLLISTYVFKEKIKAVFSDVRNAVSRLNSFVQEHISGMSIVQIFNSEKEEYAKFVEINKEHTRANVRSVLYYSIYFPVAELLTAISIALVVWLGTASILDSTTRVGLLPHFFDPLFAKFGRPLGDTITIGTITAFIMYINMFFRPIRMIADRFNTLQMGVVSSKRILDLLDSKSHIPNNGTHKPDEINGKITFDHVWFAYQEEDYILKDIQFEINPGETLALVGATGAGKSSVVNLISRFYEINKGSISIDGKNIAEYDLHTLRQKIGIVLQDVFLFSGTVAHNIRLGDHTITDEKIWDAATLVGADKFIRKLPGGLEYNVQERGGTLSVGQRQLLSFVRAMVYDPKVLILDEATSSVDTETEEMIQFAIDKMMKGRTSIVIAHRLSTIQKSNRIVVLDKGEMVEQGTHQELLDKKSYYSRLHEMQFVEVI